MMVFNYVKEEDTAYVGCIELKPYLVNGVL